MDWTDSSQMSKIYREMISVMVMDVAPEQTECDELQMIKSASDDLNHLIIEMQKSGPTDTSKEQLISVIDKLKEAGSMLFSVKPITSYTGLPDDED